MNDLQIFKCAQFGAVRTFTEQDGRITFCGTDIAKALGYSNPRKALIDHCKEKGVTIRDAPTKGGIQQLKFITEGNLYRLIVSSKLPSAEKFESWIFDDVIPTIRKTGTYSIPQDYPSALRALADKCEETKKLEAKSAAQEQVIHEMQPKVSYVDRILNNHGLVTITQIAKDYGMTGTAMNKLLHGLYVQYKTCNGQWLLYRKYQGEGYTHSKTHDFTHNDGTPDIAMTTEWTQKGRLFLYNLLKVQGILPLVEQPEDSRGERYAS